VLIAAAVIAAIALTSKGGPAAPGARAATSAEGMAATWVDDQVSHDALVACDPTMRKVLTHVGFPGRKLQTIRLSSPYPVHAQIVVETPAIRSQFGSSLATNVAPEVLASFGSGRNQVVIRVIAPSGAAAYRVQLAKDLQARRAGGQALLHSRFVTATSLARQQLLAGRVDTRLITVLFALASKQHVSIVSFGSVAAGQSPALPLRLADLASHDNAAHSDPQGYVRSLQAILNGQGPSFRPTMAHLVTQHGQQVFRIVFPAPSPLGLFGAGQP
jgi:hypothetical protein